ncbi:MAG TPA: PilZ domain-containing protein [Bryobacteraceae bacterium]|nr:PilZ domain-containing protein [Bryobacteraceae bacterium]
MDQKSSDRRKEPRYPLSAQVLLRKENGESVYATAIDISSSGMRLQIDGPASLELNEVVTVELELPDQPEKPFSSWGIGRVAHLDSTRMGVELSAGRFAGSGAAEPEDTLGSNLT